MRNREKPLGLAPNEGVGLPEGCTYPACQYNGCQCTKPTFADQPSLVDRLRTWELDTKPEGYPAVQMRDISALCDEVERLQKLLQEPTRGLTFAGWFAEVKSSMSYRLWEQGGHAPEAGEVPLYV